MIIVFLVVVITVMTTVHWYLWRRLVRDVSRPGGWYRRTGTLLVFLMPMLMVTFMAGGRMGMPFAVQRYLAWPGSYWFVVVMYLLLTLAVGEVLRPLLRRALARHAVDDAGRMGWAARTTSGGASADRPGDDASPSRPAPDGQGRDEPARDGRSRDGNDDTAAPAGHSRRLFVARTVAIGAGAITAGTVGYGSYAARDLTTKQVTVPLARLPRAAHGYRIAVVSDIHLSAVLGRSHCRRVVDAVNRTQPDAIAVVGDLVDAGVADLRSAAAPLAELTAQDGAYFVTGNHEYYTGVEAWLEHIRELGIVPLENARTELPYFDLAGVNDVAGEDYDHGPDFEAALGDRDPQRTSVLLAHQPVQIHDAVEYDVDLQLSGHTHGGQLWPGNFVAGWVNPTVAGLESYGDTQLYVTRGAGTWGPPVRVGADPDITLVELASRQA